MTIFNRIVAVLLWLALAVMLAWFAIAPLGVIDRVLSALTTSRTQLASWQTANATNFLIGQIALGVAVVLVFGSLLALELLTGRRRGVRIRTVEGGSAEMDTDSIGRRLEWHLDQLAEVIAVVPSIKSRGGAVDIRLEIETAPTIDVPMKTDEVVAMTRDIIEQDLGLRLGKLDVRMRYAPYDPDSI